jgi:2-keto-3-deoxy-L-rhamnonate aldolase RhmA
VLATIGYDWLVIDCEHTETNVERAAHICRAGQAAGTRMLVRTGCDESLAIRQALDSGADGVIVPLVHTAQQARAIVDAAKFPPGGRRGHSFTRANRWGIHFQEVAANANDNTLVVVMIESARGVEEAEAILAVEGIDGAIIGPYDLSGSYGIAGQLDHDMMKQAEERVLSAAQATGKAPGQNLIMPTESAIDEAIEKGFRFIALGGDTMYMVPPAQKFLNHGRQMSAKRCERGTRSTAM